jgi:DHA1 family bicyclomycin/chloramphenicol resistance-like MFS transporter
LGKPRFQIPVLAAYSAAGPAATQIFLPALPALQADFGVSVAKAQLSLSLALFAMAAAPLACGPWSDRVGRRPAAICGLALLVGGSLVCLFAQNILTLILGRIVQASGGACGQVLAPAIVRDVYGAEEAASKISLVAMTMALSPMIAAVMGGLLTDQFGWRSNFLLIGALGALTLLIVVLFLAETRVPHARGSSGQEGAWGLLLKTPRFHLYAFQYAFLMGVFFAFVSAAPYVVTTVLHQPATVYGLGFIGVCLGYVLGNAISARYSKRAGIDCMVLWGTMVSLAAILTMVALLFSGVWTVWAIFIPGAISGAANGVAMPNAAAGAVNAAPEAAGAASGITGFLQLAVGAAVSQAVGTATAGTPYPMAIAMTLMSLLALLAIAIRHVAWQ